LFALIPISHCHSSMGQEEHQWNHVVLFCKKPLGNSLSSKQSSTKHGTVDHPKYGDGNANDRFHNEVPHNKFHIISSVDSPFHTTPKTFNGDTDEIPRSPHKNFEMNTMPHVNVGEGKE